MTVARRQRDTPIQHAMQRALTVPLTTSVSYGTCNVTALRGGNQRENGAESGELR
jgi:hypothetical protein